MGIGDSITCGPDEGAYGIAPRPWAQWLAEIQDMPFHRLAQAGAVTPWIAEHLLPRVREDTTLACVHVGTNDVRSVDWDPVVFAAALDQILGVCEARAARTCVATIPLDLGRPRAGPKVADLNAIVRRTAARHDAIVVWLDDLRGWREFFADAVHPTALGQLVIAERAAHALGMPVRPWEVAAPQLGWRFDMRYLVSRQVSHVIRDWSRRIGERYAL